MANPSKVPQDIESYGDNYSESGFWSVLGKAGAGIVDKALTLYYVMKNPDTPLAAKTIIAGALGYLILPTDLIPDVIPILGWTDDAGALAAALNMVDQYATPSVRMQVEAKKKELGLR